MTDVHGREYTGNAQAAKGRQTTIRMNDNRRDIGALSTVKVLGRQELTNPEKAHDEHLFLFLTGKKDLRTSPFVRSVWFPTWKDMHEPQEVVDEHYADSIISMMGLNDSQRAVVQAMVGEQPIVVTHGIPTLLRISTTDPTSSLRSSWYRKDHDNIRSIAHLGSLWLSRVDCRAF
jgi:regulator of nonsense transcripts 1